MHHPIKIDIWSDVACPWCYIGKRRLEAALETLAGDPDFPGVTLEYRSYELNAQMPVDFEGGVADYLSAHLGTPRQQAEAMMDQVTAVAARLGLDYDMGAVRMTRTVKAHQLLHFAKAEGRQVEMKERLLRAVFVEGLHVGRVPQLAALAAEIGLDGAAAAEALEADAWLDAVREDQELARDYGVRGVPLYVIDGEYGISGAQDPLMFVKVLRQVAAQRQRATV